MRVLLLLLSLLRLTPDATIVASGESHCARSTAAAAGHGAMHQEHSKAADNERPSSSPADCPHCPPADCAQQNSCTTAIAAVALPDEPADFTWQGTLTGTAHAAAVFRSVTHTPPTRPPATHLA